MDENKQGHVYIFESKYFIHIFTELIEKRSQLSFNLRITWTYIVSVMWQAMNSQGN